MAAIPRRIEKRLTQNMGEKTKMAVKIGLRAADVAKNPYKYAIIIFVILALIGGICIVGGSVGLALMNRKNTTLTNALIGPRCGNENDSLSEGDDVADNPAVHIDNIQKNKPPEFAPSGSWSSEQIKNTWIIIDVGRQLGITSQKGKLIGIATAIKESGIRNLDYGDRDSLGIFQQRSNWGTEAERQDPYYASWKFYSVLLKDAPDYETREIHDAAEEVQHSHTSDKPEDAQRADYAPMVARAPEVIRLATGESIGVISSDPKNGACGQSSVVGPGGWTVPVKGPISSRFRTSERPNHAGIDISPPRGTQIRAAASGKVTKSECNIKGTGSCDVDGSEYVEGCGWTVTIDHGGGIQTRYCHMVTQPDVKLNDQVSAGQVIGKVGSSGNSTGPHLHFETYENGPAVDPEPFMRSRGAPLGEESA